MEELISISEIETMIYTVRGQRVMIDEDIAKIYGVTTKRLNEQVKRNKERFPSNFMFQLKNQEVINLRSQNATSSLDYGGRRYLPFVFTEHGALMLANVIKSKVAIQTSIQVIQTFVKLREMAISHESIARKIIAMEKKYDHSFKIVFDAIRDLMSPKITKKKPIGFRIKGGEGL